MTTLTGTVNLKFDAGSWVSRLEAAPTKKEYGFLWERYFVGAATSRETETLLKD
jgi:hypothetical protein